MRFCGLRFFRIGRYSKKSVVPLYVVRFRHVMCHMKGQIMLFTTVYNTLCLLSVMYALLRRICDLTLNRVSRHFCNFRFP